MQLFTQTQLDQLKANCQAQIQNNDAGNRDSDFKPVVKLFTPDAQCTWRLTELGNAILPTASVISVWDLLR